MGAVSGVVDIFAIARNTSIGVNGLERNIVAPAFFAASRVSVPGNALRIAIGTLE
jgi:hypothetical protein